MATIHRLRIPSVLLAVLLGALLPAPARGAEDAAAHHAAPDRLLVDTLENGLQVVVEENRTAPIVHVRALMRIGALYEGEYLGCGLSHYMEHIVAGGSTRRREVGPDGAERWVGRTEEESKAILKSIGGNRNAVTSHDYTAFYLTTKNDQVGTALDLTADWLMHCQFDPAEVEREQRVVQQELLRNLDDPQRFRGQLFGETMFKVHPARLPVIGFVDSIERVTREDMLRFYDRHYTPQNCVVAVVGDVNRAEVLALVKRHFGGWKRKPLAPYMIPEEPEQTSPRWVEKEHGATKTCLVTLGVPTIPLLHPDLYALDTLSNVLGLGPSSRLPRRFEHDPARAVSAVNLGSSNYTPVYGAGRFVIGFGADTPEHARALVEEIWTEVERLKEDLVSPEEIARSLKVLEKYFWQGRADIEERAQALASNLAWVHDPLHSDRYLEQMRHVTPEQVREAARRWLGRDRLNVVIVKPPAPPGAPTTAAPTEREGEVRKVVLENGLTVLLKRLPDYGMVDAVAAFHGGVLYEDEATNGLFFLMANTFWRGTGTMSFPALAERLDALGMDLGAESQNNAWFVKAKALATDLEPALSILADVLLRPAIDPQWVEQVKRQILERVYPNLAVNPEEVTQQVLRSALYPTGPYRRQRFGTPEAMRSFDVAKVRALYEAFARPNNAVLAVYGDLDVDATEALVRRLFGAWVRGAIPPSFAGEDPGLAEPKTVELQNRQVRVNYRLAWRAYGRQQEAETAAMSVMNAMLGASGWLHSRLREGTADYVYAVSSMPWTGDRVGHFAITTDFSPKDEAKVLEIIDAAVEDMKAGRFTDEEFALAKQMILCYDALGKKDNADVVSGDALSELFGTGYDNDVRYFERIRKVTREDVLRVAGEIFARPALRILVRPR